jgi:hypothetical protein
VKEDSLHVLIIVMMVAVASIPVIVTVVVRVSVPMVCMPKSREADDVDKESQNANNKKLVKPV